MNTWVGTNAARTGSAKARAEHGVQHRRAEAVVVAAREDPGEARLIEVVAAQLGALSREEGPVHGAVELVAAVPFVGGGVDGRLDGRQELVDALLIGGVAGGIALIARRDEREREQRVRVALPGLFQRRAAPPPPARSAATRCAARRCRSPRAARPGRRRCPAGWAASRPRRWRRRRPATPRATRIAASRRHFTAPAPAGALRAERLVERDVVDPEVERRDGRELELDRVDAGSGRAAAAAGRSSAG